MIGVLFIGMYPGPLFEASEQAAQPLFDALSLNSLQAQAP